ncbi:hypothetical protein [[Limnothrix rosea] IAM M-220]|uniref:hypothetical protein n=1 Tax=[Limnothrix rosea] IAM M-220 TaxID=454133 RepID=UPI0015C52665|nr:hypothetical protein [[Limnothrix rosea] IAM M-220]
MGKATTAAVRPPKKSPLKFLKEILLTTLIGVFLPQDKSFKKAIKLKFRGVAMIKNHGLEQSSMLPNLHHGATHNKQITKITSICIIY